MRAAPCFAFLLALGCSTLADEPRAAGGGGQEAAAGSFGLGGALDVPPSSTSCVGDGLRCRQVRCPADSSPSTTSVSGVVYDPGGRVPLYNAVVYVVDESKLFQLHDRAQCESCSAHFPSGALAVGLTDSSGSFTVPNMPVGKDVPLVIQLGKWRRVVKIPYVEPCADTRLDREFTRLPRNSREGDLPHVAVTTGASDALECLVKKLGVDVEEFSPGGGPGRVHLFSGFGAAKVMRHAGAEVPLTPAEELWKSSELMLAYDMVLMSCEGQENIFNPPEGGKLPDGAIPRPASMHREVRKYADLGGRIFGSHWHHRWINSDDSTPDDPYPAVASFAESARDIGDVMLSVDSSFPKGLAMRDWLVNVGASTTPSSLWVVKAEHSVDSVDPLLARRWIYGEAPDMVQYFSFTTPVGQPECGRMVFSDVHVTFGGGSASLVPFPDRCGVNDELTPQEKALAFMIFDLSSCIQKEDDPVRPPITIVK